MDPGYHRLWAHRSYRASPLLGYALALFGTGQGQLSIRWWVKHHRAHHRYVDTDRDPYDARRGFYHTHIGWLLSYDPSSWGEVDVSDLDSDPIVLWQERYFWYITAFMMVVFPTAIAHFGWNDFKGGFVYGAGARLWISFNSTWFVNSIAHASWAGSQPYSSHTSARNVPLLALITGGESNHNFHHTFPMDYRNGLYWYESDISRYLIELWSILGLASNLKAVSPTDIERARRGQRQKQQQQQQQQPDTLEGSNSSDLRTMSWAEFVLQANSGYCLLCIRGVVYDLADFIGDHPGGPALIQDFIGKDATEAFYTDNAHSAYASSLLKARRTALVTQ